MITTAKRVRGTQEYYFSKKLREVAALNEQGKDIINLGIGSPDLRPPQAVIDRLILSAQKDTTHGYQSYKGIPALRKAFADWYSRIYGVSLNSETEILPLIGSKEGITYISNTYIEDGDEVLVPNPGYPAYGAATKIAGGAVRYYDLKEENGWLPDLEKLSQTNLEKVKLMWVNYPHMPSGARAPEDFFRKLVKFTGNNNILLCNDNPYSLILNDNPQSVLSFKEEHVLELNSLSKSHNMAGWRMGTLCGSQHHIQNILVAKSNVDSGMFLPVQEAAVVALEQDREWYETINAIYRQRRAIVWKLADTLGCTYTKDQSGLFVWAKAPAEVSDVSEWIDRILYEAGVFITPGSIFGSNGDGYIRISLCCNELRLQDALERIKKTEHINILK